MEAKKHEKIVSADADEGVLETGETETNDTGIRPARSKGRSAALTLAKLAILSAISYILYMFVKFPLPMLFPSFLDMQISDLPALIGGFAMGPWYGCIIIVVKCVLKMPFTGTACVGELGDIIMGIAFVLPASYIYKYHKTKKGALLSLAVGVLSSTAAAMLVNRFVLIPFYLQAMFGGSWEPLLGMVSSIYPDATAANFYDFYIFLGVLPFNLLRCLICAVITFFTYKGTSRLLHY
ncbi:MAG: ECF transporter S component [Clostridia bacterium]|nr:ECF transporter S component [Clostridia bacterium]